MEFKQVLGNNVVWGGDFCEFANLFILPYFFCSLVLRCSDILLLDTGEYFF